MFFRILIAICFCFLLIPAENDAGPGPWEEPWGSGIPQSVPEKVSSPGQRIGEGVIRFFIKYVSPVDGDRCPSYPTCSQYALDALRKHGGFWGSILTFDRLLHESDEVYRAPLIRVQDRYRYYDPVENNDFWWNKSVGAQ